MSRSVVIWFSASVAAILLGMLLASMGSGVGALSLVGGIFSLVGFLLYGWWRATTENDQFVWQTPHKPRRQHLAERAASAASGTTPPSDSGTTPPIASDTTGEPLDSA